jgi:hypothetical protein
MVPGHQFGQKTVIASYVSQLRINFNFRVFDFRSCIIFGELEEKARISLPLH